MSPTYTYDAAQALERLLRKRATGLFHLTNAGTCTWYEFAREALNLAGLEAKVEPVTSQAYSSKARRSRDSSLISKHLDNFVDKSMRPWQQALKSYLVEKDYRDDDT